MEYFKKNPCPYCDEKTELHDAYCRKLGQIERNLSAVEQTPLEMYQKWPEPILRQEHERIINWEDVILEFLKKHENFSGRQLYRRIRACEVVIRNELPRMTPEQWRSIHEKNRKTA
ncbi:hypothetical protein HY994_00505 [Candidatus Micrarchaeota archaeon]|nr:hypothetical protein [Candidatus Micrarchaeota archaeon]